MRLLLFILILNLSNCFLVFLLLFLILILTYHFLIYLFLLFLHLPHDLILKKVLLDLFHRVWQLVPELI
jgi:hypothetical protein